MSAGFAAADVSMSGSARMGIVSAYDTAATKNVSTFVSRVRATFTGSGVTDAGLSFGGTFGIHDASGANSGTAGSTFISGAFGKISMGDVSGGDKAAVGQIDGAVGYTGLGSGNSINYVSDAGGFGAGDSAPSAAKVNYTYSANGLTVSASSAQLTNGGSTSYGIGASYTTGSLTLGLGYGAADISLTGLKYNSGTTLVPVATALGTVSGTVTDTTASVAYVMGATKIKAIYQQKSANVTKAAGTTVAADIDLTGTTMGLSVTHKIDALTLTAYSVSTSLEVADISSNNPTNSRYGIGANYDLGGGATIGAGWVSYDDLAAVAYAVSGGTATAASITDTKRNKFDVGINFSF